MKIITQEFDVVVCGGGLAGFCAAIAAARQGKRTCLVQDRPVLGGNSSSEIRVTPHGAAAFHGYARETGILSEVLIEERARNHEDIFENGWTNSVWDLTLYDLAKETTNLTLQLNTAIVAVELAGAGRVVQTPLPDPSFGYLFRKATASGQRLEAVVGRVGNAETELILKAGIFIDCTGDGVVADLCGCEWRMGSEGRDEFQESHAPATANRDTMGSSIHFRARNVGRPAPFVAPDWAIKHDHADFFYKQGRKPKEMRGGYWWLEIGVPWDTIYEAEDIRHELTRHTLGVWDWIKNRDPLLTAEAANWALDWIGQVPGKRESRRIAGLYTLTEHDVRDRVAFSDEIAFGGWFLDLHTPGGLLAETSEPASAEGYEPTSTYSRKSYVGPYGLPLRMLMAKDVPNLLLAGRNVSATHAALGTVRVMATTALMGQAAGTAAALALDRQCDPCQLDAQAIGAVQQQLLRDGCFLPHRRNEDPQDLARLATATASSEAVVSGVAPDTKGHHEGLAIWRDQAVSLGQEELTHRRGQWIAVGTSRIESVEVCLTNLSPVVQEVPVTLVTVDHIWDYRTEPPSVLASGVVEVPVGEKVWAKWECAAAVTPGTYVRLDLSANPQVAWHSSSAIVPGHLSAYDMGGGDMRRYGSGVSLSFRVNPPQPAFGPANVLTGVTRPHAGTNLWRSDPEQALPQWLQLTWAKPQALQTIELTFPGHLVREYHAYSPFYRDPQCPKDFSIEVWTGSAWSVAARVSGNYQRRRVIRLAAPVSVDRLRVVVSATNGDPAAAIYEVRAYL